MRVFIGPIEVAGLGLGWATGLRAIGVPADLVCAYPHPYAYSEHHLPWLIARIWIGLGRWRVALPRRRFLAKGFVILLQQMFGWCVLAWAISRYDAFIFLYGQTITNTRAELALLRAAGKRVVVVFVGSDARPPYIDGSLFPADRPFDADAAARAARHQKRKVAWLERGANVCINAPATAHFQQRRFVNWFAIGIPRTVATAPHATPPRDVLRLLHSPSHPVLKGTALIRNIVDRLNARGLASELNIMLGRPNAEVLEAMRDCDLVLDQLYSDTPMAGFATEGASQGCAVLVGGYRAAAITRDLRGLPVPPTRFVLPEEFEAELERLLRDTRERESLGATARAFVAKEWAHAAVAQRIARVLRGDVPDAWWCYPDQVDNLHGCGLSDTVAREHVRALLARCGAGALQLDDKPALRDAFVTFAHDDASGRT